jgi:hypothetical protein
MKQPIAAASAIAAVVVCGPALAQGRSQGHKKNPPPSRSDLPAAAVTSSAIGVGGVAGVTPFAWIDDATLIRPGTGSIALSIVRWQGADTSEVDAPVVDAAIGIAPRVHLTATVPRVVGNADPEGAAGGIGTSYIGAKLAMIDVAAHSIKVAVSPTLEVLSRGVVEADGPTGRRVHVGLPVMAELDRGPARLYAAGGYFSRGVWFTGGGAGVRAADRLYVSANYSRSWRTSDTLGVPLSTRVRNELTGAVSYLVAPNASIFASVAKTIATLDSNGATTVAGGVAFSFLVPSK